MVTKEGQPNTITETVVNDPVEKFGETLVNNDAYSLARYMLVFFPGQRYVHPSETIPALIENMRAVAEKKPDSVAHAIRFAKYSLGIQEK